MLKKVLFLFVAILASMQAEAQYPINSIDKIFIEGDSTRQIKYSGSLRSNTILDGDILVFDVPGIGEYITQNHLRTSEVRLMIDTCEMAEFPAFIEDFEAGLVKFRYFEDELSSQHRQTIYSNGKEVKKLQLGLRIGNEPTISYSEKGTFYFAKVKLWSRIGYGLIIGFILFFISLILFFPSMLKSDLQTVKMDIPDAERPKLTKKQIKEIRRQASYSFGKTQMVFWTFIIVSGFIYIWGFTDQLNSINTTALILLGISSLTISTAAVINKADEEKAKESELKLANLEQERITSRSFLKDILSDGNNVSIHRVQAFVFNLVFGIAFLKTVIVDYSMPDFDSTQLLLLGLSNGTYTFMKTTENK